jgi:hypothetical protein
MITTRWFVHQALLPLKWQSFVDPGLLCHTSVRNSARRVGAQIDGNCLRPVRLKKSQVCQTYRHRLSNTDTPDFATLYRQIEPYSQLIGFIKPGSINR